MNRIRQWWRDITGKSKATSGKNLPVLPDEVDDNFYLASASRAGEIDRNSGAYDEYLFSEDGLDNMPFEASVDHHLSLVEIRLRDRGRRAYLERQDDLFSLRGKISRAEYEVESLQANIAEKEVRINEQVDILEGNKTGRAGLYWPGNIPENTSILNSAVRIALPIFVFVFVGIVDLGIIYLSFLNIPGFKDREAFLFTFPAVGVQLVFPHLVGDRLNLLIHGYKKKIQTITAGVLLLVIWLAFAYVLTEIRMNFIVNNAEESGEPLDIYIRLALYAGNMIMLVGLGTWLLALAAKHNHHQGEYNRLSFYKLLLKKRLQDANARVVKLQAKLPALEASLEVIEKSYIDAVETSKTELAEAAKSVYRRSLVNQFGSVEFTSSFLGSSSSATPKRNTKASRKSKAEEAKPSIKVEAKHTPPKYTESVEKDVVDEVV